MNSPSLRNTPQKHEVTERARGGASLHCDLTTNITRDHKQPEGALKRSLGAEKGKVLSSALSQAVARNLF